MFLSSTPTPPLPSPSTHTLITHQNKLSILKDNLDSGVALDKDQLDAVTKIEQVSTQLELVKELQKQFTTMSADVSHITIA